MITGYKTGDVTQGIERHVAFAINREGDVGGMGLASRIAHEYWNELLYINQKRMGEILSKDAGSKTFHAMVVHSLEEGWEEAPKYIEACFDELEVPTDEEIATVAMGAGMIGMHSGANPNLNLEAMDLSDKSIVVYDQV